MPERWFNCNLSTDEICSDRTSGGVCSVDMMNESSSEICLRHHDHDADMNQSSSEEVFRTAESVDGIHGSVDEVCSDSRECGWNPWECR